MKRRSMVVSCYPMSFVIGCGTSDCDWGTKCRTWAKIICGFAILSFASTVPALERWLENKRKHPKFRGQAAESSVHCLRRGGAVVPCDDGRG